MAVCGNGTPSGISFHFNTPGKSGTSAARRTGGMQGMNRDVPEAVSDARFRPATVASVPDCDLFSRRRPPLPAGKNTVFHPVRTVKSPCSYGENTVRARYFHGEITVFLR